MGRKTGKFNLLLVAVIIGIVGISAFSINAIAQMDWSKTGEETGSNYTGSITAYKDGEPISEPILMGAFARSGTPIDSLVLKIGWVSTGESLDWSTFNLEGTVRVSRLWDDGEHNPRYVSTYSTTFTSGVETGDWTKTLVLGTDICKASTIQDGGWILKFEVWLEATVQDTLGQPLTETVHFAGTATIDYTSDFGLTGYAEW